MIVEAPACNCDLTLLAFGAGIACLVVTPEEHDDPVAVGMAEDAQQDPVAAPLAARRLPEHPEDLAGVMPEPELEQAVAELFAVRAAADANAVCLEDLLQRDADRASLHGCQILTQPAKNGTITVSGLVELERVAGHC